MIIATPGVSEPICLARQAIFDARLSVWGYELLFRRVGDEAAAGVLDADQATRQVVSDGFLLAHAGPGAAQVKLFINFTGNLILDDTAAALPPHRAVVEILETVDPSPEIVAACLDLKKRGYMIALDDFQGDMIFKPLFSVADIVKIDVLGLSEAEIKAAAAHFKPFGTRLLAEKVEDKATFETTKALGFTLFQGYYFKRPEIIPGRKLSSSQTSRLRLLAEISRPDPEPAKIADIIKGDLALSYRLLRYINSAGFGLALKVDSIERAITFMGLNNLKRWLQVSILSDLNQSGKARELSWVSAHRAQFLSTLASERDIGFSPDAMFLIGLFSMLDAILGQSMDEIVDGLTLDDDIKGILVNPDHPGHVWLDLLTTIDEGRWDLVAPALARAGLPKERAAEIFTHALTWSSNIVGGQDTEPSAKSGQNVTFF